METHLRLVKERGKLSFGNWRLLLRGSQNELLDLIRILSMEGEVFLTSQKPCESLPERVHWGWKSGLQRKAKIWTSRRQTSAWLLWLLMTLLRGFASLLTVIFLVLLLFLISHGFYFLHTLHLFLAASIMVIYIMLLLKTEVKFFGFWLLWR